MKNYMIKFEEFMAYANRLKSTQEKIDYLMKMKHYVYTSMLKTSIVEKRSLYIYYHHLWNALANAIFKLSVNQSNKVKGTGVIAAQQTLNLK